MFDRKFWGERFSSLPNWPCPTCTDGHLTIVGGTLKSQETNSSKSAHSEDGWEPEWIEKRFSAHMSCSNKSCGEGAIVAGTARCELSYSYDDRGETEIDVDDVYYPVIVHPSPRVISIPEEVPQDIQEEVQRASSLIWNDVASSANKLRLVAERILTALGVPKTRIVKGERRPIILMQRIELIKPTRPEVAELLHSIRFLGNQASHEAIEVVDRRDLLSAFEIIEHALEVAFSKRRKRILKAARDIRRRKGRPAKRIARKR